METLITNDIKVTVKTTYQPEYSQPQAAKFIHAYHIEIENLGSYPVQLMRRRWEIVDSTGDTREVEGAGVVGQQPFLSPGGCHQYTSWCNLHSDIGMMRGTFRMYNHLSKEYFEVSIPKFRLIAPMRLN